LRLVTTDVARLLGAWSDVFSSPVVTEVAPGRVWEVATGRGDRYVLKKVSTFGVPNPVRRFTSEARILTYLLQRGVPVAVPVLADHFIREHDLIEESWVRTACWIGDNFDVLRLPASALSG
jgi:hypothetical protein